MPRPRRRAASCRTELREAPGARPRRRGLASGGDRDRRLAAGRAPPPAGGRDLARRGGRRARLGPQHSRLRPARGARGLLRAPGQLRRPPRRRRSRAAGREPRRLPRGLRRPRGRRCSAPRICCRTERIDAMVGGVGLGLDLAEELARLAPFGMGNPGVRLLVPSARVSDVRPMGEGKHSRFSLHSGAHRALGVAFGRSSLGVEDEDPVDAAVRLEVNHWNGAVEPRVVLRELYPLEERGGGGDGRPAPHACECDDASGGSASKPSWSASSRRPPSLPGRICRGRGAARRRPHGRRPAPAAGAHRRAGLQRRRGARRLRGRVPTRRAGRRRHGPRSLQRRRRRGSPARAAARRRWRDC